MDKNYIAQLYHDKTITSKGVLNAIARGRITIADAVEILGDDNAAETVRAAKLMEISKACNTAIVAGVDVPVRDQSQGVHMEHFNLALEDQSNINNLFRVVELGGTEFPYQADDGSCKIYSAAEIAAIYIAAQTLITAQTAYHNALKAYINTLMEAEEIATVQYGMELPEPFASELSAKLAVAQAQMEAILQRLGEAS